MQWPACGTDAGLNPRFARPNPGKILGFGPIPPTPLLKAPTSSLPPPPDVPVASSEFSQVKLVS